jgi:quinoprotein glucose dehydrogenase
MPLNQSTRSFACLAASMCLFTTVSMATTDDGDWPSYGGDLGSQKYAPLDQINAENVKQLQMAWSWDSPDNAIVVENQKNNNTAVPGGFKATPIEIDNVVYISSSFGAVSAIDAVSGKQLWLFESDSWKAGRPTNLGYNTRGVSYWSDGKNKRIFFTANDAYLWALDAATGKPDSNFGDKGRVDLTLGLGREVDRRDYTMMSPALVVSDVVVVGSSISDGPRNKEAPPGHVRAYHPLTGKQVWIFHTIPQKGEVGNDTWKNDSWKYTGNTNVWTMMSADEELGYVYLPISTPTNDWYGGNRLGNNLFAESLVCVEAATGKLVWHFQMVHHGLWDYDLPAAPNLIDINVDGKNIKAVAQISKQGFTYVFDRVTGEPVWPIEERSVPQTTVPGEKSSPSQPFPTKPLAFDQQGISDATLIDYTPELRAEALAIIKDYDYGPLYTPPSLKGTIVLPGWGGGGEWHGAAFDPDTGLYYIPSASSPIVVQLREANTERTNLGYTRGGPRSVNGPKGLPIVKPPYSRITAINMNTGDHQWMVPHGEGMRQKIIDMGIEDPGPVGSFSRVGPFVTKTLLFIAQQDNDRNLLRAYNKATGEIVHEVELSLEPSGTPMTYMADGRQFILIGVGGGNDAKVLGFALPK